MVAMMNSHFLKKISWKNDLQDLAKHKVLWQHMKLASPHTRFCNEFGTPQDIMRQPSKKLLLNANVFGGGLLK